MGNAYSMKNSKQKQLFVVSSIFQQAILTSGNHRAIFQKEDVNQHINKLVAFWNLVDKYQKNIAKGCALITPKEKTSGKFSFSTVVTPECLQELTQISRGLSPLIDFMTARLANI